MPATFPTLSSTGQMQIKYPTETWEDPAYYVIYENGVDAVRSQRSEGRWKEVQLICTVTPADLTLIYNFLKNTCRMRVFSFNVTHPKWGTLLVRYMSDDLPIPRQVQVLQPSADKSLYEVSLSCQQLYPIP